MRAIHRKLLRDLWGMRAQAAAIALVIVAGVATYVAMRGVMTALQGTLDRYYREYRFAEGFATVRRAPETLHERLRAIPGIAEVQTRVTAGANIEVPGFDDPVSAMLVSVPPGDQPALNQLALRAGRLPELGREDEVVLNETFAEAHALGPGDRLTAIINGRRRTLRIVGVALSPEFLMQIQPGSIFPDPERYGVMWMARPALAAAYDMEGAFNDVAFTLAADADLEDVIDEVDLLLERYGGPGAIGREDQPSHFFISEEFRQLRGTSTMLPVIFLAVAAFLLNIVVTRLISLQRDQVAVLKAFGYTNRDVGLHYVEFVLLIAVVGATIGTLVGAWLGQQLGQLYLAFYRFPYLDYTLQPGIVTAAVVLTCGAAVVGVIQAVRRAVRLPPAEAMRPAPPASYRATFVERIGLQRLLDQPTRMILRNLERQPVRALLTIVGIASSCAILIMGLFFGDSIDYIIDVQYGIAQREDLTVTFTEPTSWGAIPELQALRGVSYVEPFRSIPVRLRHEHRSYEAAIEGVPRAAYLRRVIDTDLEPIDVPPEGVVLTSELADILAVQPGETVTVEVLEGSRRTRTVPVVGLTRQFFGLGAYMAMDAANRMAGAGDAISGAFLMIDERHERTIEDALQDRPRVASIVAQQRAIDAFYETSGQSLTTFTFILSLFAGIIAFGVVYNSARISLSERDRELASLRVLGFTRGEVSYILLGELAVLTLLAIPIGFGLGAIMSAGIVQALQTELYRFPVVLGRGTFTLAAVVVLVAGVISSAILMRKINRLDLVGVLKTRE